MNLEENFKLYLLKTKGLTNRTVKNYLSDNRHFIDWLSQVFPECRNEAADDTKLDHFPQKITLNLLKRYRAYLSSSDLAKSTVKRRLATVRIFCQFLLDQNLITTDPSVGLENPSNIDPKQEKIDQLTTKFQRYLSSQGASQNTIKNYLADIRGYLEWAI